MPHPRHRLVLCGVVLLGQVALAQQPPTPQPPPPQPTFQSAVTLVTSDLIVRDRRGQFQAAIETIYQMLNNPVVLISDGYDLDPFASTRAANSDPLFNIGGQFNDAELTGRLAG